MARKDLFRVGRVSCYRRGRVWYLRYHEDGKRRQVRGGTDRGAVRQLAAQVNAQLETGAAAATSFESISIEELRRRWLAHHEHVLQSSVATINRYRTATDHLLRFVKDVCPVKSAANFQPAHAEHFVRYLRELKVAPNGHPHARKRSLRGKGIKYVLEVCRTLFNFACKRRHLPPYAENPFSVIQIDRMPDSESKPFVDLSMDQERRLLEACDAWQFPIFLTLVLTGLRPGELTHLLLPDDLDLQGGWLHVRNKPDLGWQVKTRNERRIPLMSELAGVLEAVVGTRKTGSVFLRRRFCTEAMPPLARRSERELQQELADRVEQREIELGQSLTRHDRTRIARVLWRDMGAIKSDRLRTEFMRLTKTIGIGQVTAPKTLRHLFATALQDANVDPLIRNQLMGHAPMGMRNAQGGLGMTGIYTHTRPETMRQQLERALSTRLSLEQARRWLADRRSECAA